MYLAIGRDTRDEGLEPFVLRVHWDVQFYMLLSVHEMPDFNMTHTQNVIVIS